ncbi:MAG: hypothetical protein QOD86_832, partial [Miltoncostaeaceae bacterium]|nr:hypothetical protein [Miltoncostaeaceae bacterium]
PPRRASRRDGWLLGLAGVGAVGVARAPRPDRRPPMERVSSDW